MKLAAFDVDVVQKTITVFAKGLENPFNDWSDAATAQGFSWRTDSVAFLVFEDADPAMVAAEFQSEKAFVAHTDAERIIQVPFSVKAGDVLDVSGMYEAEDRSIPLDPGDYCMTFELGRVNKTHAVDPDESMRLWARFTFVPGPCEPAILKADKDLSPPALLVLDGKAA